LSQDTTDQLLGDSSALPLAQPPVAARPRRWIHLDVLRGIAILLVLGAHTPFRLPRGTYAYHFFDLWKRIGWVGVDMFFVLSGFLIGGLLFAEHRRSGSIAMGRFIVRRGFKIWPAYLVFLAATFAWDVADRAGPFPSRIGHSASAIWPYLLHAQNYRAPLVERIGHAWSLAVEEHFYVLLPLLLLGLMWLAARRRTTEEPFRAIPWICLGLLATCLGLRICAWWTSAAFDEFAHHWPTHARLDSLFVGVALAYAVHFARPRVDGLRRRWWAIALASAACFAPFTRFTFDAPFTYTIGYALLAVGSAGLVLLAWFASEPAIGETTATPRTGALPVRWMARIGAYSYAIYLWHMPFTVPIVMRARGHLGLWGSPLHYPILMALYALLSIALGALMFHLIERPALALRERLFPAQRKVAAEPLAPVEVEAEPVLQEPQIIDGSGELQPAI
jgi:peptidoglycan/LPS O-acetylase OafA/YrhL